VFLDFSSKANILYSLAKWKDYIRSTCFFYPSPSYQPSAELWKVRIVFTNAIEHIRRHVYSIVKFVACHCLHMIPFAKKLAVLAAPGFPYSLYVAGICLQQVSHRNKKKPYYNHVTSCLEVPIDP